MMCTRERLQQKGNNGVVWWCPRRNVLFPSLPHPTRKVEKAVYVVSIFVYACGFVVCVNVYIYVWYGQ